MINMDMIGRIRDGKVYVGGVGTGSTLKALLEKVAPKYQLKLDFSDAGGYGSSDHTSFTTKQVPVLFFFSGLHGDYHKPSDTWDKIDAPGTAARLLALISEVADRLIETADRPDVRARGAAGARRRGAGQRRRRLWPLLRQHPGFRRRRSRASSSPTCGPGSPAAQAGFKAGDVLVEFDGKPIGNLYDFTYALRAKKPGDEVAVRVLRGGKPVKAKVKLAQRK